MSVFFNGRLWTTPAVMSVVDDSAMYDRGLTVGNILAVIGRSQGGKPATAMRFGSPSEARDALISGDLLKAIEKAFDASAQTGSPATIIGVRVNPATQSSLTLKDGAAADAITLQSQDYGKWTTGIRVKIETGTDKGKKVSTMFDNAYYSQDNVASDAFLLKYTGGQPSANVTVNQTNVILEAPTNTVLATLVLADYADIFGLVDAINMVTGFDALVLDGNGDKPANHGIDNLAKTLVNGTGVTVTRNVDAIVDYINSTGEGFVSATRLATAGAVVANIGWTSLAGGTDGTVTNTEWQNCFDALQTEDVQWVVPLSSSAAIHAMADTHAAYMSNVARQERRAFVGTASGTSDATALGLARDLNSDRTALVHVGMYDYDANGVLTLYEPYMLAAQIAGGFSGVNPGTTLTNKTLKVRGLERKLKNPTDTDRLILGGVLPVEDTPKGYKVTRAVTTWLATKNYNRVEVSVGAALDFISRNVRNALEDYIGEKGSPRTLTIAVERTKSVLSELARPEPSGPGVIVGDAVNPPFKNIVATIEGDVMRVEFQCSPVIPINYIPVTIHAVPWSGRITAATQAA